MAYIICHTHIACIPPSRQAGSIEAASEDIFNLTAHLATRVEQERQKSLGWLGNTPLPKESRATNAAGLVVVPCKDNAVRIGHMRQLQRHIREVNA